MSPRNEICLSSSPRGLSSAKHQTAVQRTRRHPSREQQYRRFSLFTTTKLQKECHHCHQSNATITNRTYNATGAKRNGKNDKLKYKRQLLKPGDPAALNEGGEHVGSG
ncbi:hypothetical protein IAQ61_003595, partial [Plenodomus lingam]|uniref:Predicted protein n=1 Tax=Leptosphaeria maculans (strain JN3 / isolate v23.1.3 / race Av1-4-5-6-7-8) TaxID=985895 RepID=E4ZR42_LEPMJ